MLNETIFTDQNATTSEINNMSFQSDDVSEHHPSPYLLQGDRQIVQRQPVVADTSYDQEQQQQMMWHGGNKSKGMGKGLLRNTWLNTFAEKHPTAFKRIKCILFTLLVVILFDWYYSNFEKLIQDKDVDHVQVEGEKHFAAYLK